MDVPRVVPTACLERSAERPTGPSDAQAISSKLPIPRLGRALVAPCTTTIRGLASEVVLEPGDDPVPRRCAVNLDSIESASIAVLIERIGRLSDQRTCEICAALEVAVDCAH